MALEAVLLARFHKEIDDKRIVNETNRTTESKDLTRLAPKIAQEAVKGDRWGIGGKVTVPPKADKEKKDAAEKPRPL